MGSVALDGSETRDHGRGQPFFATWSPSGTHLFTHRGAFGTNTPPRLDLQSLFADDGAPTRGIPVRLPAGPFAAPAYSPDGTRIAVALVNSQRSGI